MSTLDVRIVREKGCIFAAAHDRCGKRVLPQEATRYVHRPCLRAWAIDDRIAHGLVPRRLDRLDLAPVTRAGQSVRRLDVAAESCLGYLSRAHRSGERDGRV